MKISHYNEYGVQSHIPNYVMLEIQKLLPKSLLVDMLFAMTLVYDSF